MSPHGHAATHPAPSITVRRHRFQPRTKPVDHKSGQHRRSCNYPVDDRCPHNRHQPGSCGFPRSGTCGRRPRLAWVICPKFCKAGDGVAPPNDALDGPGPCEVGPGLASPRHGTHRNHATNRAAGGCAKPPSPEDRHQRGSKRTTPPRTATISRHRLLGGRPHEDQHRSRDLHRTGTHRSPPGRAPSERTWAACGNPATTPRPPPDPALPMQGTALYGNREGALPETGEGAGAPPAGSGGETDGLRLKTNTAAGSRGNR
jgi:hypothetical protein